MTTYNTHPPEHFTSPLPCCCCGGGDVVEERLDAANDLALSAPGDPGDEESPPSGDGATLNPPGYEGGLFEPAPSPDRAKEVILKKAEGCWCCLSSGFGELWIVVHVYGDVLVDSGESGVERCMLQLSLPALGLERSSKAMAEG